jgi:hypothetical protein
MDCNSDINGSAYIDGCGDCVGGNTGLYPCPNDCLGVPGGTAYYDNCGTCDNDPSNDCTQDCDGVWGGSTEFDECGVCGGDDSSCSDCAGVPNGDNELDSCGTCDSDSSNDCVQDCAGTWGGNAELDDCGVCDGPGAIYECGCTDTADGACDCSGNVNDECGVCGGNGMTECPDGSMVCDAINCDDEPSEDPFIYYQSTLQAFYYFETVAINGMEVGSEDWVGAFNGDVCVGARKWDTSLCGNGICDLPVMGDDGSEVTEGYMNPGEFPIFKIFDASENIFYSAQPSGFVSSVQNDCEGLYPECMEWNISELYVIDNLNGWIWGCTDSNACNYNADATMDNSSCSFAEEYYDCDGNCIAELDCAGICGGSTVIDECEICGGTGIPDGDCDCEGNLEDCAGVCGGIAVEDACGVCDGDGPPVGYTCEGTPELFDYNQSTLQAFYYFQSVTINGDNVDADDWVGAFNGDVCVGSRKWDISLCNGGVCDLPMMGADENEWTDGYLQSGDIPTFKIFDGSTEHAYEVGKEVGQ